MSDAFRIPDDLCATSWPQLEPLYRALVEREPESANALEQLLLERSELDALVSEAYTRAYIRSTCFTNDAATKAAFLDIVQKVEPQVKRAAFELDRKIAGSPYADELDPVRYEVLLRELRASVGLFRDENLSLQAEDDSQGQEYMGIVGAMSVELDGETLTMQQASLAFDAKDRQKRRAAWIACGERRLADRARIDDVFDRMVAIRTAVARNAGFDNYRDYAFVEKGRFDYTVRDCEQFHETTAQICVPFHSTVLEKRRETLGIDRLTPWDVLVDPEGGDPLRPYESVDQLVEGTSRVFHRLDPELGALFDTMRDGESLDLDSREGKSTGGYQANLDAARKPFIFMNAAGTDRDLETMLHEGGHALHSLLCRADPILRYRECCAEFSEVASMSMELLTHPYLDEFYDAESAVRARRKHLQNCITRLPWIVQGDAFQHWIYANPDHTRQERDDYWLELDRRFRPDVSWDGVEEIRRAEWQRVPHFFMHSFYMIEYGIAQLGALQLWLQSLESEERAIANYKRALTLGGSRPLPELFKAAELEFDFSPSMFEGLTRSVEKQLAAL